MGFTDAQLQAISCHGHSLLVSAAAGAGKTTVLTERVIKMLTEQKRDIDRLLILTFTDASASDMKIKISKALKDAISKSHNNAHLKRQAALLPCAKISTIHSACLAIVKDNFEVLGLDPLTSIAEEERIALMREELLENFMENVYGDSKNKDVIEHFAVGRGDDGLFTVISKAAKFLSNEPYEELFFERAFFPLTDNVFDSVAGDYYRISAVSGLRDFENRYISLIESVRSSRLRDFLETELETIKLCIKTFEERNYQALDGALKASVLREKKDADEPDFEYVKKRRKILRDDINEFKKLYITHGDEKQILSDRKNEIALIKRVFELASEFNKLYLNRRVRNRIMNFDDVEKYTLSLLIESYDGENIVRTPLAKQLSEQYDEIIVDEYQDCNRAQELIFRALSKDMSNLFTVGDVKQSIYQFRNAEPSLFLQKQKNSVRAVLDIITQPSRIELTHNFRSHPAILNFTNYVFECLMRKERGGIDYTDSHQLTYGGLYGNTDSAGVEFTLIQTSEERSKEHSDTEVQALCVAKKIKSIIGNELIYDKETKAERPVQAKDIAILMSYPRQSGAVYERALEKVGLSCVNSNPSERYLDTPEVEDLLAFLQTIDNPYNEIPLVTLMYSDYFGFTSDELGAIRSGKKYMPFYDAVKEYAKTDNKTRDFVERLEALRALSLTTDVYGVISAIFETSGILMRLSSKKNGDIACANLSVLADFAKSFESVQYKGLFSFVNYIIGLKSSENGVPPARLKKSDDYVSLLSIHKSKGLEFPVIFLVSTEINLDRNSNELIADNSGLVGCKIRDFITHRDFNSLHRLLARQKQKETRLFEAMRVLYVALTRAMSRLYIYAAMNAETAEKVITGACMSEGNPTNLELLKSPTYFKWLVNALCTSPCSNPLRAVADMPTIDGKSNLFKAQVIEAVYDEEYEEECVSASQVANYDEFLTRTEQKYRFEESCNIPAKLSVSEIKSLHGIENGAELRPKKSPRPRPRFMQKGVKGTDIGNATHEFLQYCNFDAVTDEISLEKEIKRLTEYEFISEHDCSLIEKDKILRFLTSDKMQEFRKAERCFKEERFMFTLPANEVLDTTATEEIAIQGILDCMYVTDNKATILDYKTDRVNDEKELIDRYKVQLDMYEKAVKKIRGFDTQHKYIYSFCLEKFIEV